MKRLMKKYPLFVFIIAIMFFSGGCSVPFIGNAADEDLDAQLLDNTVPAPDTAQKPDEKKEEDKKATVEDKNGEEKEDLLALSDKSATLDIDSGGRTTPFVPYAERNLSYTSLSFGELPYPPSLGVGNDEINSLVSAKVTGILYEQNSPSAIINVKDDDFLVKPGDEVEGFKISSITKDYVAIQTGSNVYRAKVGDIVEGDIYGSGTYNLGYKFAGRISPARKEDVMIFATKKHSSEQSKGNEPTNFNDMSLPPVPEVIPKINLKTQAGEIPLPINGQ